MRTTVRLDENLMREVKQYAASEGKTLTAVIEQALRETIARRPRRVKAAATRVTTVKGKGLRPGVDLDDSAALLELMDRSRGSS